MANHITSGIGTLDKAMSILDVLETGPASVAVISAESGIARSTAQRLVNGLVLHRLAARDRNGNVVSNLRRMRAAK